MANAELAEDGAVRFQTLRTLNNTIQTASLNERITLFSELRVELISLAHQPSQVQDAAAVHLARPLTSTLIQYADKTSRVQVKTLLEEVFRSQSEFAIKLIRQLLKQIHSLLLSCVRSSRLFSRVALTALDWIQAMLPLLPQVDEQTQSRALESFALACSLVAQYGSFAHEKKLKSAVEALANCSTFEQQHIPLIVKLSDSASAADTLSCALFNTWALLTKYASEQQQTIIRSQAAFTGVQLFIRTLLPSRTALDVNLLVKDSFALFAAVDASFFKDHLLPAVQKSILRNPEVAFDLSVYCLSKLSVDLSLFVDEVNGLIIPQLISKNESLRKSAINATQSLPQLLKQSSALEKSLKTLVDVYNGSQGKLQLLEQRVAVLETIGNLSSVSDENPVLCDYVFNLLSPVCKSEMNEVTLQSLAQQLSRWSLHVKSNLLIDWYKNVNGLKNSSPAVKAAYASVFRTAINENNVDQLSEINSFLVAFLGKALNTPAGQTNVVCEVLHTTNILLRMQELRSSLSKKHEQIEKQLLTLDKLHFLSERFLTAATETSLLEVGLFIEKIFTLYESRVSSKLSFLTKALMHLMIISNSPRVRLEATQIFARMNQNTKNDLLFTQFSSDLRESFLTYNELPAESQIASANSVVYCIRKMATLKQSRSAAFVANQIFLVCHMPFVHKMNANLWYQLLKHKFSPQELEEYVQSHTTHLANLCYEESNSQIQSNGVQTLTNLFPEQFIPLFTKFALDIWNDPRLSSVTRRDFEIFCTPEGELYDQSVIEQAAEQLNTKNIRKENKLYSFKEQMEELKLRREMQAKRKPELTKKQIEAKNAQLAKESLIREQVTKIHTLFNRSVNIIRSCVEGNALFTSFELKRLVPVLLGHMQSPLCAADLVQLYLKMHACILERGPVSTLIYCVQQAALRQLNPICALDVQFEHVQLNEWENALLSKLHNLTCGETQADQFEASGTGEPLRPPTFTLILPFISHLLQDRKQLDDVLDQCMAFINRHVSVEYEDTIEELEDLAWNPIHLPRRTLCSILIQVIQNRGYIAGKLGSKVLLQIAENINDYPPVDVNELYEIIALLMDALISSNDLVRSVSLEVLLLIDDQVKTALNENEELRQKSIYRLWVAQFDENEACSALACDLWISVDLKPDSTIPSSILDELPQAKYELLEAISSSMVAILREHPEQLESSVNRLLQFYTQTAPASLPKVDKFDRPIHDIKADIYYARLAIALILTKMAALIPDNLVEPITKFHVSLALGDVNNEVRKQMLQAMTALIGQVSADKLQAILNILELYLDTAENNQETDRVRTSVVVLMGRLAARLDKNDPKIKPIIAKLIETLSTPSQMVQEAVSSCLPDLCPCIKEEAETLLNSLLKLLLDSDNYGEKKGAAYGLAGFVRGFGIMSMREMGIIDRCLVAIANKKSSRKLGALIAFEVFCTTLNVRFEPYVVCVIPHLLRCFGDASENIRRASKSTAKSIMNSLSEHGVRFILPSLLEGLNHDNWRTKVGSIELLGAMSYCAPRQLSSCLPTIVPHLMEVMCNSHSAVQAASNEALQQIGNVIRNPEILAIVPTLLAALDDPANKTQSCLVTMLNTKFVHFIDAPSLALIMPVIKRAFQARSTSTRKMAAQIIGNMYSLTDQQDLAPYLPAIVPGIKQSLLDPVPDVRAATARALGTMVRGMGDEICEDILPWLMSTLTSEVSSVDRSGAAQGLAEVIGGLGLTRLHKLMPEIISTSSRTDISPFVKDGYLMLYIYLPIVFTQDFTVYISRIIHPILKALADESEFVRETAFKAGQRVVALYANSAIQLLLPELEKGLFDENWRIRYSSVQLLGDLLYKISGVSGKMTTETAGDDDNFGTEKSCRAILATLGNERRNRVLSGLYMGRLDVSLQVRQAALHVWKIIVSNTPRTLKEILPTLFSLLLSCLASKSLDQQQVAARTLGDLVRKLGERILPQIIPILEQNLCSERPDERQGVCIGLSEIIASTSKEMVEAFVFSLVPTVRKALSDELPEVRQAAASTFDNLHGAVGTKALEEIIPPLLQKLTDPKEGDFVLDGLRKVLALKGQVVLPYLIPQLTAPPVNARALSLLSSVSGEAMGRHLLKLLPALMGVLVDAPDEASQMAQLELCSTAILCVQEESSVQTLVDYLLGVCRQESNAEQQKYAAVLLLQAYCANARASLSPFVPQLLRGLISMMTSENERLLNCCWDTLQAITKSVPKNELGDFATDLRSSIRFAQSDLRTIHKQSNGTASNDAGSVNGLLLPGFCLDRGVNPLLSIYREAMAPGGREQRELATLGTCEMLRLCHPNALRSSMISIIGPFVRMLAERLTDSLKLAIVENLSMLMYKDTRNALKPFMTQLQQTLIKCALDTCRQVRLRSAGALAQLLKVHPRPEVVMIDLNGHLRSCINNVSGKNMPLVPGASAPCDEVAESICFIIRLCATELQQRLSANVCTQLVETVSLLLDHPTDDMRLTAGSALGALSTLMTDVEFASFAKQVINEDETADWTLKHGRSVALRICLKECPARLLKLESLERVSRAISRLIQNERVLLITSGVKAATYLLQYRLDLGEHEAEKLLPGGLVTQYVRTLNHSNNEVKNALLQGVVHLCKSLGDKTLCQDILRPLLPVLVNGTKEKNTAVRASAEQALIALLHLRKGEKLLEEVLGWMDAGPRESLQICVTKSLRRVIKDAEPKGNDGFDDTLLI